MAENELAGGFPCPVSNEISKWIERTAELLCDVQAVLEHVQPDSAAPQPARDLLGCLPARLRQCRAQVPTPEMVQTWVRAVTAAPPK